MIGTLLLSEVCQDTTLPSGTPINSILDAIERSQSEEIKVRSRGQSEFDATAADVTEGTFTALNEWLGSLHRQRFPGLHRLSAERRPNRDAGGPFRDLKIYL
jgi:hypothetical protein